MRVKERRIASIPADQQGMQAAHIIHAHIALHKTDLSDYIAIIGSGMIQRNEDRAQTSSCRPDLEKVETAIHLNPGSGRPGSRKAADRIRAGALLLPALVRYDWQHSSSQLPIIPNDARRISSPGGRYCVWGPAPSIDLRDTVKNQRLGGRLLRKYYAFVRVGGLPFGQAIRFLHA